MVAMEPIFLSASCKKVSRLPPTTDCFQRLLITIFADIVRGNYIDPLKINGNGHGIERSSLSRTSVVIRTRFKVVFRSYYYMSSQYYWKGAIKISRCVQLNTSWHMHHRTASLHLISYSRSRGSCFIAINCLTKIIVRNAFTTKTSLLLNIWKKNTRWRFFVSYLYLKIRRIYQKNLCVAVYFLHNFDIGLIM